MCITSSHARLSKTNLYVGEGLMNDEVVHVLAYQNNARNEGPGANSMLLPFPTAKEMGPDNIIDTRTFKSFLTDISNASKHRTLGDDSFGSRNMTKGMTRSAAQVFDSGSYTVILADNVDQVPEALSRVPERKRPSIDAYFLWGYGQLYKDQPIALCCWEGSIKAEPLLWWYTPKNANHLFVPTMDAHDGKAPRLTDSVQMDHIISLGSRTVNHTTLRNQVIYKDALPEAVKGLLPTHVFGTKLGSTYTNGDMFAATADLNKDLTTWKDLPAMKRGVSFVEASIASRDFELHGWG